MIKNLLLTFISMLCLVSLQAQTTILDFETPDTNTDFQYFGSTLGDSLTSAIANPDASGINTSGMVMEFVKPADAETWAGGFTNPNPTTAIDFTIANEICLKVWTPQAITVLLKLEESTNGYGNWENPQQVDQTNTWVEVCYSALAPNSSDQGQNGPATGGIYTKLVLFFDYGNSPAEDFTYYFDDVILKSGDTEPADITFSVDMNDYTESFTTVYVSGTFNDWSGTSNPLADGDGDGVWTGTITDIPVGGYEYKFTLDDWAAEEDFNDADYTCTVRTVTETDVFTNRKLSATEDASLLTTCFNSCYACGDAIMLTVNLGEGAITVGDEGLFIAGGGNFGLPGDFLLTDDDGDGIHSGNFERQKGFESFYTFTNGICPDDWSCKEQIEGQDCANASNYNDRSMGPLNEDTTISTCFGICTDNTDCMINAGEVTFEVDMNAYPDAFTTVYVSGNFNGWSGTANPLTDNGNGIWSTTISLAYNDYEFKFQLDDWIVQEEFVGGEDCTLQSGDFVNRTLTVDGDETVCFAWQSCESCLVSVDNVENTIFSVQPTLVTEEAVIIFGNKFTGEKSIHLFNAMGQHVCTMDVVSGTTRYTIDVREIPNGIYFIHIQTEDKQQTQRIIVNK